MKVSYRYTIQCMLAAALLIIPVASASAQADKPAVVVSVASIDEQFADARYVLRASGFEQFIDFLNAGQGFAQGIDTTKPIGAYLTVDGMNPQVVGFVGITDFDTVVKSAHFRMLPVA